MLEEKHPKWAQWLFVGPVGMRSPVLRSITAVFQQCVKIVGVLGEAAPTEKCGCVNCGKTGAHRGGSTWTPICRNMMWYQ